MRTFYLPERLEIQLHYISAFKLFGRVRSAIERKALSHFVVKKTFIKKAYREGWNLRTGRRIHNIVKKLSENDFFTLNRANQVGLAHKILHFQQELLSYNNVIRATYCLSSSFIPGLQVTASKPEVDPLNISSIHFHKYYAAFRSTMFDWVREFADQMKQTAISHLEFKLIVPIFLCAFAASCFSRSWYKSSWKGIEEALDKSVNTAFRLSSHNPLELTAECRRFAATNYGVKSQLRYFRMMVQFPAVSNVLHWLYQFIFFEEPKALLEVCIEPTHNHLYAAIIKRRWVAKCQKAFKDDLPYFQSVKDVDVSVQRFEICQDLAELLELDEADFVVLNRDMITLQCNFSDAEKMIQAIMTVARQVAKLELNKQQQEQISKRIRNAEKQLSSERAKKEADENEENAARKVEELQELLRTAPLDADERAKIQVKIDEYVRKEEVKASRKMEEMMGLGGGKGSGKKVFIK